MKWEYKIAHILANEWTGTGLPNELNQRFDAWGAEGWELIGTESIVRSGFLNFTTTVALVAFFKRSIAG